MNPPAERICLTRIPETGNSSTTWDEDENDYEKQMSKEPWRQWTCDELADVLRKEGLAEVANVCRVKSISGDMLGMISPEDIDRKLGITDRVLQLKMREFLEKKGCLDHYIQRQRGKVVNDAVHGHIELHPLCVAIIDTPQFQRLRYLKQLGTVEFVYPAAVHTRFEHSLGVYHLAGLLIKTIRRRQPKLGITDKDVLCVQIAGLCHDMGHGPFSHMFGELFISSSSENKGWKHEDASVAMFEHMYKDSKNNLAAKFEEYRLDETDRKFITEQIGGPRNDETNGWPYEGRKREKAFLYDIVANRRNGIDVDRWDYLSRDCLHLGMKSNFDHHRFIHFARVISVENSDETQICLRDKEAFGIYQMYFTRYFLQKMAYQHRVSSAASLMVADALQEANEVLKMPGQDGKKIKLSDCVKAENMSAYTYLTDEIIHQILLNPSKDLEKARRLVNDLWRRKLYKCVDECPPIWGRIFHHDEKDEIKNGILSYTEETDKPLPDQVVIEIVNFNFGIKDNNPMANIFFYSKAAPDVGKKMSSEKITHLLPNHFEEQVIRVFFKPSDTDDDGDRRKCANLRKAFKQWFKSETERSIEFFMQFVITVSLIIRVTFDNIFDPEISSFFKHDLAF